MAAAAAALAGCGSSSDSNFTQTGASLPPSAGDTTVDVAIIGAGAAGIGAGRALTAASRTFFILESRDRIGGRCACDNTLADGLAFDLGGQWFHQVTPDPLGGGTTNPLFDIALEKGHKPILDDGPRLLYPRPPVNILDTEAPLTLAEAGAAAFAAGAAAALGQAPDISFAQATAEFKNEPYYDLVTGLLIPGSDLNRLSCEDFVPLGFTGSPVVIPTVDNFLIEEGFGNFLATLAKGLPIRLSTHVSRIEWGGAGVTLTTSTGTIRANQVIITIPAGVLNANGVEFAPALPARFRTALAGVEMTKAEKIALLYDHDVFDVEEPNTFAIPQDAQAPHCFVQVRAWNRRNYCIVICGGPEVPRLNLVDYATGIVERMYPAATRARLSKAVASGWSNDPLAQGAFSYVTPGNQSAREIMAEPIGGRLYFAGEHVSVANHSSIHGAYISGQEAAARAIGLAIPV